MKKASPRASNRKPSPPPVVLTVGHSTRSIDDFIELLRAHKISRVVDVRTIPRSRHNPQFNRDAVADSLARAGIAYTHMAGLGGLRHPKRDSPNDGWRNASFRGYADYMQTPEFAENLEELIALAKKERVAIMCAEAVPWRCHRSLIADALTIRGIRTEEILSKSPPRVHTLTPFARVRGLAITYPRNTASSE